MDRSVVDFVKLTFPLCGLKCCKIRDTHGLVVDFGVSMQQRPRPDHRPNRCPFRPPQCRQNPWRLHTQRSPKRETACPITSLSRERRLRTFLLVPGPRTLAYLRPSWVYQGHPRRSTRNCRKRIAFSTATPELDQPHFSVKSS